MYSGRVFACSNLPRIVHLVRDLAGCQISLTPSAATFANEETARWLAKYFAVGEVEADERRRLLAYGRDLLNSDYANHRLTFQLFAQSPPFSHLLAVYNNYDFEPATELMCQSARHQNNRREKPMTESIVAGGHRRIRPFNTADTYPEQNLSNDLCQAVVAGNTVYLRGQVAQDLDLANACRSVIRPDEAHKTVDNIELLLAGGEVRHSGTSSRATSI